MQRPLLHAKLVILTKVDVIMTGKDDLITQSIASTYSWHIKCIRLLILLPLLMLPPLLLLLFQVTVLFLFSYPTLAAHICALKLILVICFAFQT